MIEKCSDLVLSCDKSCKVDFGEPFTMLLLFTHLKHTWNFVYFWYYHSLFSLSAEALKIYFHYTLDLFASCWRKKLRLVDFKQVAPKPKSLK